MGCIGSIPVADSFLVPEVTFQASGGGLMPGLGDDASLVLRYGNTVFLFSQAQRIGFSQNT